MRKVLLCSFVFCVAVWGGFAQQQTADGGYIIAGTTSSYVSGYAGFWDALVYKLDATGHIEWSDNYGGVMIDYGMRIIQTDDGGYALLCFGDSFTYPYPKPTVFKLDAGGSVVWRGDMAGEVFALGYDIKQTGDGGFVVTGFVQPWEWPPKAYGSEIDIFLWKLDGLGATEWLETYGGGSLDVGFAVAQAGDGGYLVAGGSESFTHGLADCLVYKMNASGNKQWRKNYGGADADYAWDCEATSDGGFVIAGSSETYTHGDDDFLVYKLNGAGRKQWRKNYGGLLRERARSIHQTSDGGYIIGGDGATYTNGSLDFLVYKLNAAGQKQWRKNYGGSETEHEGFIWPTTDGGTMLFGETFSYSHGLGDSDFLIYKLDKEGKKMWRANYGGIYDEYLLGGM